MNDPRESMEGAPLAPLLGTPKAAYSNVPKRLAQRGVAKGGTSVFRTGIGFVGSIHPLLVARCRSMLARPATAGRLIFGLLVLTSLFAFATDETGRDPLRASAPRPPPGSVQQRFSQRQGRPFRVLDHLVQVLRSRSRTRGRHHEGVFR